MQQLPVYFQNNLSPLNKTLCPPIRQALSLSLTSTIGLSQVIYLKMLNVNTSFQYIFCLLLFLDFKSYLGVFRPLLSSKEIHLFFLVLFHFLWLAFWSIWSWTGAVGCKVWFRVFSKWLIVSRQSVTNPSSPLPALPPLPGLSSAWA